MAEKATVKVSSFKFEPKVLTVTAGTTVEWVNEGGRHTVEADNGSFKSDVLTDGKTFEHTFDKPGTYAYHCSFPRRVGRQGHGRQNNRPREKVVYNKSSPQRTQRGAEVAEIIFSA